MLWSSEAARDMSAMTEKREARDRHPSMAAWGVRLGGLGFGGWGSGVIGVRVEDLQGLGAGDGQGVKSGTSRATLRVKAKGTVRRTGRGGNGATATCTGARACERKHRVKRVW